MPSRSAEMVRAEGFHVLARGLAMESCASRCWRSCRSSSSTRLRSCSSDDSLFMIRRLQSFGFFFGFEKHRLIDWRLSAEIGVEDRNDEQGRDGRADEPADHSAAQRRILLAALAQAES